MKKLILSFAAVLLSTQAFAEGTELHPYEAKCLTPAAQEIVKLLLEGNEEYEIVYDKDGLATHLRPVEHVETNYFVATVLRDGDLEEIYFDSDWSSQSYYAVFKITAKGCETMDVGSAQNDGDND